MANDTPKVTSKKLKSSVVGGKPIAVADFSQENFGASIAPTALPDIPPTINSKNKVQLFLPPRLILAIN
jgi:hypothetical protein